MGRDCDSDIWGSSPANPWQVIVQNSIFYNLNHFTSVGGFLSLLLHLNIFQLLEENFVLKLQGFHTLTRQEPRYIYIQHPETYHTVLLVIATQTPRENECCWKDCKGKKQKNDYDCTFPLIWLFYGILSEQRVRVNLSQRLSKSFEISSVIVKHQHDLLAKRNLKKTPFSFQGESRDNEANL